MKHLSILFLSILLVSCNNSPKQENAEHIADLNGKIDAIILSFMQERDTITLDRALVLNRELIDTDLEANKVDHYRTRCQLLSLMGNDKDAFVLEDSVIVKNESDVKYLVHSGLKYKLAGKTDSAEMQFQKAHNVCDTYLKLEQSNGWIIQKSKIYMYQGNKEEAKKMIAIAYQNDSTNKVMDGANKTFESLYSSTQTYLNNLGIE